MKQLIKVSPHYGLTSRVRRKRSVTIRNSKRRTGVDEALLAKCRPGFSLPGEFYRDEQIYHCDVECVWRAGWLFAGHSCEIPNPGDFFTLEMDADPIVVARDEKGFARAHHNVCRHRGSIICTKPSGNAARLVCPYHQWAYGLDGKLIACRGMQADLDKSQLGLHALRVEEIEGLIFVSLAPKPPAFAPARDTLAPLLKPQAFNRAKVARVVDYLVGANWKLVWENNRECYHCNLNHPQYIKANFDHYNADDATARVREQ